MNRKRLCENTKKDIDNYYCQIYSYIEKVHDHIENTKGDRFKRCYNFGETADYIKCAIILSTMRILCHFTK